ncbi:MAG: cell wall-active antibiotics response protein [Cellulomonadaceae bacterium]|nr:cell wall-active antibiotics response protein [Cellulomonadaceae bacterium]
MTDLPLDSELPLTELPVVSDQPIMEIPLTESTMPMADEGYMFADADFLQQSILSDLETEHDRKERHHGEALQHKDVDLMHREVQRQRKDYERAQRAWQRSQTPVVKGPGAVATLAVLGTLTLLTAAAFFLTRTFGALHFAAAGYQWNIPLALLGAALVLLGVVSVGAGVRGRNSGFLGLIGVLGLIAGLISFTTINGQRLLDGELDSVTVGSMLSSADWPTHESQRVINQGETVTPDSIQSAADGFRIQFGEGTIDLTDIDWQNNSAVIPLSASAGNLTVVVPPGVDVTANVRMMAGTVNWEVAGNSVTQALTAVRGNPAVFSTANPEMPYAGISQGPRELFNQGISLLIDMGAGNVTITDRALVGSTPAGRN